MKTSFISSVFFVITASTVLVGCDQKMNNSLVSFNQCNVNIVKNELGNVVSETRSCKSSSFKEIMASTSQAFGRGNDMSVSVDFNGKKIM